MLHIGVALAIWLAADALLDLLGKKAALRIEGIRHPNRFSSLIATAIAVIGWRVFDRFVPLVPQPLADEQIGTEKRQ